MKFGVDPDKLFHASGHFHSDAARLVLRSGVPRRRRLHDARVSRQKIRKRPDPDFPFHARATLLRLHKNFGKKHSNLNSTDRLQLTCLLVKIDKLIFDRPETGRSLRGRPIHQILDGVRRPVGPLHLHPDSSRLGRILLYRRRSFRSHLDRLCSDHPHGHWSSHLDGHG